MRRHHILVGARGGSGTTTVSLLLAVAAAGHGNVTVTGHDPGEHRALAGPSDHDDAIPVSIGPRLRLGSPAPLSDDQVICDLGHLGTAASLPPPMHDGYRWLVVRGPSYLALRTALATAWRPDGVILVQEQGRALSAVDVADTIEVPVVATIPVHPDTARACDAGLLVHRVHRLPGTRSLFQLVSPTADPTYENVA